MVRGAYAADHLARVSSRGLASTADFRFPVQFVVRARQDFRGLAGTVSSGEVAVGDRVVEPISGKQAGVRRIVTMGRDLERARQGQAIVLELDADLDVSRGAVLARQGREPAVTRNIDVRLVWLSDEPLVAARGYLLRTSTDVVPIAGITVNAHLDLATLAESPGRDMHLQRYRPREHRTRAIGLHRPLRGVTGDRYLHAGRPDQRGPAVAGGVVVSVRERNAPVAKDSRFRLTRDVLARGVRRGYFGGRWQCRPRTPPPRQRGGDLFREAGVAVELEDAWDIQGIDAASVWLSLMAALSFGFIGAVLCGARLSAVATRAPGTSANTECNL